MSQVNKLCRVSLVFSSPRVLASLYLNRSKTFFVVSQACGVDAKKKRGNWILHILFTIGAAAGNEEGFICCFPFVFFAWDLCTVS